MKSIRKYNWALLPILSILVIGSITSCKKYADPPPYFEDDSTAAVLNSRKVLLIGIDGAVGSEYKALQPPVMVGMLEHSKFSWEALPDSVSTDASSWKTIISGVTYNAHGIKDSSFFAEGGNDDDHSGALVAYPSLFLYILESAKANTRTSLITPWSNLSQRLTPEVRDKVVVTNDAAVKDSAVSKLKATNSSDILVVNFNSVAIAGKNSGFLASSAAYKDAILKVDGYIGEIMTALKARPEYNKNEEWLVMVVGTHGGSGNSYGGDSPAELTVPALYYNERLKTREMVREGSISAGVRLSGAGVSAIKATLADGGYYDIGNGQQTVQIKVKGPNAGSYPHFFSKINRWAQTPDPGWSIFTSGGNWNLSIKSTTSAERRIEGGGAVLNDQWHTLTFVVYDSIGRRFVKRFTDGFRMIETNPSLCDLGTNYGPITSTGPLLVGHGAENSTTNVSFNFADISIFNTALTDAEIKANICLPANQITSHPKYNNLIGFWPGTDGQGAIVKNLAKDATGKDLTLQGSYKWASMFSNLPCTIIPIATPNKISQVIQAIDVAPTIFYWLRIPVVSRFGWRGQSWLQDYETEFVPLT